MKKSIPCPCERSCKRATRTAGTRDARLAWCAAVPGSKPAGVCPGKVSLACRAHYRAVRRRRAGGHSGALTEYSLAEELGQPVIVDNRAGADAVLGTEVAAKAPADGYTILQVATTQTINMALRPVKYDLLRDFAPQNQASSSSPARTGNAGILDLIAALEWVRDNIGRFGGDAGNVTICCQSGGGSKVATLMAMPRAKGLFHKAIIQSASSLLAMATREDAERNTWHFLRQLGLDGSDLWPLHELPAATLLNAMGRAIAEVGLDNYRPFVDGCSLPHQPFSSAAVQLSADIPLLTGWCENEQRLSYASLPEIYRQGADHVLTSLAATVNVSREDADRLLQDYRAGRPGDTPGDLYAQIVGDHRYRRSVTRAAESQLAHGGAPVYMYLLNWKSPVLGGLLRSPHTMCLAFMFANVDIAAGMVGHGTERYALQDEMVGA